MSRLLKNSGKSLFALFCCTLTISLTAFSQTNPTPAADRLQGLAKRQQLDAKSQLKDIPFRNIGPAIMSGRVADIDANPEDPTEFYVAYASGGLWHTTNNGQSFSPIFDSTDIITIGDIAINWKTNPRQIWVGTGEVNSSRSSYAGTGIYKSTDNGAHWTALGLPETHHIGKILLNPKNPDQAWVGALGHLYSSNKERGVFKTSDGGKTWKQTLFVDENTGVADMDINPNDPNEVYAAAWYRVRRAWKFEESGKTSGIYKSNDGGETWKLISGAGSGFMEGEKTGRIGITVFPQNPSIVYAIVDNNMPKPDTSTKKDSFYKRDVFRNITKEQFLALKPNLIDTFLKKNNFPRKFNAKMVIAQVEKDALKPTVLWDWLDADDGFQNAGIYGCEVYRSDDGGKSWHKTHKKGITIFNTYGYYFAKIYTSATNADKVYILGFNAMLSYDGGKTFENIDKGNVHPDHHALWIDPKRDSHFINGNDGGCNITYDDGLHWFKANTPSVGQFYNITVDDAKPYNVYGGLQDNGSWWGPSTNKEDPGWVDDGVYPFKNINGGDGMQAQVDTRDNATVYSGSQFGVYSRYNKEKRGSQKFLRPFHELGEAPLRFNWQTPILLSKHNQDVLYYGASRFYRSLNKGDTMIAMSGDLTNGKVKGNVPYGTITTISESPLRFGTIYAGTDDGNIHLTRDGGYNWVQLNQIPAPAGNPKKTKSKSQTDTRINTQQLWVSRLVASQYKEGRVYLTLNGYRNDDFNAYVYMSEDFGGTWKAIGKDLPAEPVNVIREDPKSDSILYVGTDGGLYVSFDQGNSFMTWNAGLPKSVPVHDIAIQQRDNEIVLGTHGRSLYVSKLENVQGQRKDPEWMKKIMEKEKHKPAPDADVDDDEPGVQE